MLVALHGMGMTATAFRRICRGIESGAYAVLYPEGAYPFEIRGPSGPSVGRAWYLYTGQNEEFVRQARRAERHIIRLRDGPGRANPIDPERCVIFGYSQGGYVAGYLAVRRADRFAAVVAASCRVKDEVLGRELSRARGKRLRVLLLHGRRDDSVPFSFAERSRDALERAGLDVRLKASPGGHRFTRSMARDVRTFREATLSALPI